MFRLTRCVLGFGLTASLWLGASAVATEPRGIEVFTVRDRPISGGDDPQLRSVTVRVYEVDGVGHLESALSEGLPREPGLAKAEARRRIGELNDARMAAAKEAANGLAKALQYGVDRYPAVVIDGTAVIYGIADLGDALRRYDAWREDQLR